MGRKPVKPKRPGPEADKELMIHYRFMSLFYKLRTIKGLTSADLSEIIGVNDRSFNQYFLSKPTNKPTYEKIMSLWEHNWKGIPLGIHGRHFNYVELFEDHNGFTAFEVKLQGIIKELTDQIRNHEIVKEALTEEIGKKSEEIHDLKREIKRLKGG